MDFLKRLFGIGSNPKKRADSKPPIPDDILAEFQQWYLAQRKPAIALVPDPESKVGEMDTRLGGTAWLGNGEAWPEDKNGVPLELLAQINLAECNGLDNFPDKGCLQFFVGRDDIFGADFDDPAQGSFRVRHVQNFESGGFQRPPRLEIIENHSFSDFSPFEPGDVRESGVRLVPQKIEDRIDQSIKDAEQRAYELYQQYDIARLERFVESEDEKRLIHHHIGGFPAFTQSDLRYNTKFADFDTVLLRLTSDDFINWGDVGEAVFMIRSDDLREGRFDRAIFSWDCH